MKNEHSPVLLNALRFPGARQEVTS